MEKKTTTLDEEVHVERPNDHGSAELTASKLALENEQEHNLTIGDIWNNHKGLMLWSFFWAMTSVGWGFDAQVNGAMISVPAFRRDFGYVYNGEYVIPASWQTAFNVIASPGQLIGGFLCSFIADRWGRRTALLGAVATCSGGIIGQLVSVSRGAFLASKLVLGLGLGFYLTLGPLMTSEISPVVLRGITTCGVNLGIAIGQLLSNAAVARFGNRTDRWAYRAPFAFQLFFTVFLLAGYPFAPESPSYLIKKGKKEQALQSLQRMWGHSIDLTSKVQSIEVTIKEEMTAEKSATVMECFKSTNRTRTIISMGVFVCQHAVGIIFILGFSSYFFQLAGLDTSKSFDLGVGVTACGVAGNIVSWFFINSAGRRKFFVWGMAILTLMLFIVAIMDVIPTDAAKWVQVSTTVIWAFVYFMTLGPMAFAILGETSSTHLRAPTAALATATQAVMGTAMNFAIPYMLNPDEGNLKGKVGFVFGGLGALATVWSYFFVPELKGRTFHEIDTMFFNRIPPRKMGTHAF